MSFLKCEMRTKNMKMERRNTEDGKIEAGRLGGKREWKAKLRDI